MRGAGISPATMMAKPRLLDLTRSLRRAGRVATGVDRVEHAYLTRFLVDDVPVYGIARTPLGYLLLDRAGLAQFAKQLDGAAPWGKPALLSRLVRGRSDTAKRAESDLRRSAIARARRGRLPQMLADHFAAGVDYYNVGHSNLTDRMLRGVKKVGSLHVLIHDVIPLEYPQYQRPGTVEPFRKKVQLAGQYADRIIYNSADTRTRTEAILQGWGHVPEAIVAHLGTMPPVPDASQLPEGLPPKGPYFVTVGTIEPRKNHAFLLDIWDALGADAPPLLICGNRGWNNDAVFARLDKLPANSPIQEVSGLNDAALAALVQGATGSLFPSFAEGFGLPPAEALMLETRVLCNDLRVLHEFLGEKPVYADVNDRYQWITTIKSWVQNPQIAQASLKFSAPTWDDHFKTVLRLR